MVNPDLLQVINGGPHAIDTAGLYTAHVARQVAGGGIGPGLSEITSQEHETRLAEDPEYQERWTEIEVKAKKHVQAQRMRAIWTGPIALATGALVAWFARRQRWV